MTDEAQDPTPEQRTAEPVTSDSGTPSAAADTSEQPDPETSDQETPVQATNDEMPDDFVVPEKASIGDARIDRELWEMLGRLRATATGNIRNEGQTAVGDGALAAESILYTTNFNLGRNSKSWSRVFPGDYINKLVAAYSAGPSDDELAAALRARAVVYLNALPGWGRHAAARVALARRHTSERVVMIHVAPGERLVDAIDKDSYSDRHGHVVDAAEAHPVSFVDLLSLERQALEREATVVVIGPRAERGHDLGPYLLHHKRPSAVSVFRRQLAHLLTELGKCVGECADCRGDCVAEYVEMCIAHQALQRHLNETMPLDEAAKIAVVMGNAPAGTDIDELLADTLNRQIRTQAQLVLRAADDETRADPRGWSATSDYRRAFRLAYAAFEGTPMASVYEAARQLVRIQPAQAAEAASTEEAEFELDTLLADGMQVPDQDAVLPGAPRVARLVNSELVPMMLDVAWNERGLGPRLIQWLGVMAADKHPAVRDRAAMMAGLLSFNDFDGVLDNLIAPWLRNRKVSLRQAAGLSLLSCAHNPALHQALRGRVEQWMDKAKGNVYTRDGIGWAYAYGIGRVLPYEGMRHLRRIGKDVWQRRSYLLALGVDRTYVPEHAAPIVDELLEWARADDYEKRLQVHAARAFVRLTRRDADGPDPRWPELLLRQYRGELHEDALCELWVTALSLPSTSAHAWQALTRWLVVAESQPEAADRVLGLVRRLVRVSGMRTRLGHQLRYVWCEQRPASRLLTAITATIGGA